MPIDAKEAVAAAVDYYKTVTPFSQSSISLEEIEFNEETLKWSVTLGININPYANVLGGKAAKDFKIFTITEDGRVLSMKIREFNS